MRVIMARLGVSAICGANLRVRAAPAPAPIEEMPIRASLELPKIAADASAMRQTRGWRSTTR